MRRKFLFILGITLLVFVAVGFNDVAFADDGNFRSILKVSGLLAAILGIIGIALAGYIGGKHYDSYTGWERYTHGAGMFFNRRPFRKNRPTYGVVDKTRRLNFEENILGRLFMMKELMMPHDGSKPKWEPPQGIEGLPQPLKGYYQNNPESFKWTLNAFGLVMKQMEDWPKYETRYALIDAWSNALGSAFEDHVGEPYPERLFPPEPQGPPEKWDFRGIRRKKPLPFKSPKHASQLIKKITHTFGATLVGITELNPDWCYQGFLRGVGPGKYDVLSHWKYAIVFGTPHEWDQMYVNPTYGSSYDAYSRERNIAGRLESFLHELGYPARSHVPPVHYDIMMPPVAVDAGLGEQSRKGLLITPELGSNVRLACVTTNVPMEVDRPIKFGVQDFCRKCKICAEKCPGGAISHKDEPEVVRGYRRWLINSELCFTIWASVAQSHLRGCRICLAVCPYTRKNNWLHTLSRNMDAWDPTGIVSSMLLKMQKSFFRYPNAQDFMPPPAGKNATYHNPPDWLLTEKWFNVRKNW
jgi:epoxyqueuosine reductase